MSSRSHLDSAVELSCSDRNSLGHSAHRFLAIAHRCPQAVRAVVSKQAQLGVSRRTWYPHSEGTGAQLHSDHPRSDAGDESAEGHLPKLGYSLCRSKSIAESLIKDSSFDIRALAFSWLVELGERLDVTKLREQISTPGLAALAGVDVDAIVLKVFSSLTDGQLLSAVDWYSIDGAVAYKSIATERFHLLSDQIRTDVSQGFSRLREAADRYIRTTMGPAADLFIKKWEEGGLESFIKSRFLEVAAQSIAAHAIPSDVALARQWLLPREERTTRAALEMISRFGDTSDVGSLLHLIKDGLGEIPVQAAMVALKLSSTPMELARELVNATSPDAVVTAFRWLLDQPIQQTKQFFVDLLSLETTDSRNNSSLLVASNLFWSNTGLFVLMNVLTMRQS